MELEELKDDTTYDGGYDDSGNMFAIETIAELSAAKRIIER